MNDLLADGLDPRPDLVQDHRAWVVLLQTATELYPENRNILKVLDGFRCLGCQLIVGHDGALKMLRGSEDYAKEEDYQRDRERYLVPIKAELMAVFAEASKRWGKEARNG